MNRKQRQSAPEIWFTRTSFSVTYQSLFLPFESAGLLEVLPTAGYVLTDKIPPMPIRARIRLSGTIARKGEIALRINSDRRFVAVDAPNPELAVSEFEALEELLQDRFDLMSEDLAHFYELICEFTYRSESNPIVEIENRFEDSEVFSQFSEILGERTTNFGVRLVRAGAEPGATNWYHIHIEPQISAPSSRYFVDVVYRHESRAQVLEFAKSLSDLVTRLIRVLEG